MASSRVFALLVGVLLALAAVRAFESEFDAHGWGTEEEDYDHQRMMVTRDEETTAFLEVATELEGGNFADSTHFATLTPHVTYDEAMQHCNVTRKGLTLCKASAICLENAPLDGVRSSRAVVPVADGKNKWVSIGSDRTCEVRDGGKWGSTSVYKKIKGLVACCNKDGQVRPAQLSRWEGFLIKIANVSSVWMVENGVRRGVPSAKSFEAMGFHWQRIKTLPRRVVNAIPLGVSLPDHDAEKNSNLFDHALLGYDHDGGNPFELYEGYLVKKQGNSLICMIVHNSKRCIPDAETFEALGFDYKFVQDVEAWLYDSFPLGAPFESRMGAAPGSEPFMHPILGKEHFGASNIKNTIIGTRAFVQAATKRILDRDATPTEVAAFTSQLRKNRNVPNLIVKLANSNFFLTKHVFPQLVKSLYAKLLERKPSKSEFRELLEHFRSVRRSGDPTKNIKQVVLKMALSKEHMDRFVSGVEDRSVAVRNLYRHLLGRDAESKEVVASHVGRAENEGWKAVVESFVESKEYKSTVGRYGVPGDTAVYSTPIQVLYKKLLNQDEVAPAVVAEDSKEASKDGWATYVEEFTKGKQYIQENSNRAFMDSAGSVITLKEKSKK